MRDIEAEEAGGIAVKGDLIVFADMSNECVDIGFGVAEYEVIVDVYDYICCRAMIKAQVPLPASYSPTIMPLTFSLFPQLAVIQKLHMATMDIKTPYLNASLPPDADWIVTTLEPHIAEVCGLGPAQEYRIANALYGLADSGRLFYRHYKAALLAEGYTMSAFDNCLFYKITATDLLELQRGLCACQARRWTSFYACT